MKKILYISLSLVTGLFPIMVHADSGHDVYDTHHPAGHAPIGVMGDHLHKKGETMLSYRYMRMDMDGNRSGTDRVSNAQVLQDFMVTPTDMDMEMHMLGAMYAPSDSVTLMAMIPVLDISMNHLTRSGATFSTRASGLGDIRLSAMTRLLDCEDHSVHLNTGVSLPSGDIDATDNTPAGPNSSLPYPMQLGSGTVDLLPGLTYLGKSEDISWGAQAMGTIRTGRNEEDYSLGDEFMGTFWGAYSISDWTSFSFRNEYINRGNVDGTDSRLNPMMIPTADPSRRGGATYRLGFGLNFFVPSGTFEGLRFAAEYLIPVYQDLDGPQLETDNVWIFGVQMSF